MDSHKISACKECWRKPKKDKDGKCMCECHQDLGQTELREEHEQEEWGGWKFVSEMLDTPVNGIYQTSKCYKQLYDFVVAQKAKALLSQEQRHREELDKLLEQGHGGGNFRRLITMLRDKNNK